MADIQALDSRAVLGLLAKAQQMFTDAATWLSFPIGAPLAFDAAELVAAMGNAPDAARHALLAEFSVAMNIVPEGVIWRTTDEAGLDDVVRDVVTRGEWAEAERTPEEEARFAAARAQIDLANPEMAEYASLKDAWIRSRERLANTPDDLAAQEAERAAHAALVAHPARTRIEKAMQDLVALDERAPHRARERFERDIGQGVGTFDDPSRGRFSPVRLLPSAVLTTPGWDAVTLDRAALDELAATAPAVLTDHLKPPGGGDDPIRAITFEYASALLHRSWFDEMLLKLRCWRFADPARLLSDGATPAAGDCPAYVRAVVFARNVTVTSVAPATGPGPAPAIVWEAPSESLEFILPTEVVADVEPEIGGKVPEVAAESRPMRLPASAFQEVTRVRQLNVSTAVDRLERVRPKQLAGSVESVDSVAAGPALREAVRAKDRLRADPTGPPIIVQPEPEPQPDPGPPLPPPTTTSETMVTQSMPAGTVIVLAFICKAVPRSPDPSPTCVWP